LKIIRERKKIAEKDVFNPKVEPIYQIRKKYQEKK
jgi:hypothetical protein